MGHGHVIPNPDGSLARCGGPSICRVCAKEKAAQGPRVHKLTKWDEGQILIKASDNLFECAVELRPTQPELAQLLHHMGCKVGDAFNKFGSHVFGLRGTDSCGCRECTAAMDLEEKINK